jgi:hypothetical protein
MNKRERVQKKMNEDYAYSFFSLLCDDWRERRKEK